MKFLIYTIIPLLFFAACTCDEGYCPKFSEIEITINYDEDFKLSELRSSKLIFLDTVRHLATDSMFLISENSSFRGTSLPFYEILPNKNEIIVLNFADFSDTLRNFNYNTNSTTYKCKLGCFPNVNNHSVDYTEVTDFFFTHKNDTIRDFEVFIEK